MLTILSVRNLLDGGWQTVMSMIGIGFAIVLIFMQLGFLGSVLDTSVLFYNNLKFDLVARSPDYYHFADTKTFSRELLKRIENVPGVSCVQPLHVSLGRWNYAERSVQQAMLVLGVPVEGQTFSTTDDKVVLPELGLLADDRSLLVDTKSRPQFLGSDRARRFSQSEIGLQVELNGASCEVVGLFKLGTGLAANGAGIVNERGYARMFPTRGKANVSLGLIQLDRSTIDNAIELRELIYRSLDIAADQSLPLVEVLTRAEAISRERKHWIWNTPVGFIFLAGVVISFIVGAIIVYIVLSADISNHMNEYATLKAIGFSDGYLYRIVIEQAVILAIVSYTISFLLCLVLYKYLGEAANLPIRMTGNRQIVVFISSLLMCCISALIAMRKLRKADPADLF